MNFVNENGEIFSFDGNSEKGLIAEEIDETINEQAWSRLWNIYINPKRGKTLVSSYNDEEIKREYDENRDNFVMFVKWL